MNQNLGLRYGLLAGFGSTFYMSCLYSMNKNLYFNTWSGLGVTILYMLAMISAGLKYRRTVNSEAEFRDTLRVTFTVAVVASLVFAFFSYAMPNFVDSSLLDIMKSNQLLDLAAQKSQLNDMESIKSISATIQEIETNGAQYTFSNTLFSFARSLMSGFIYAALAAYLTKKQ
jgi:predicted PurR-regulated permease PerM